MKLRLRDARGKANKSNSFAKAVRELSILSDRTLCDGVANDVYGV